MDSGIIKTYWTRILCFKRRRIHFLIGGKENGNWKQGLLQHLSTVKTFHSVAQWMAQALGILHFKKKEVRSVECEPLLGSGHLLNCYHHPKIHMGSFIVLCEFSEFLLLEQQRGRPWKPWNSGKDLTKAPGEKGTAGQYIVIANRVSIVDTCPFILWPLIIDLNRCHHEKKNGVLLVAPATRLCSTLLSFMHEMEAISFP